MGILCSTCALDLQIPRAWFSAGEQRGGDSERGGAEGCLGGLREWEEQAAARAILVHLAHAQWNE